MKYVTMPMRRMWEPLPDAVVERVVKVVVYSDGTVRLSDTEDERLMFDFGAKIDQWSADHLAEWLDGLGGEAGI